MNSLIVPGLLFGIDLIFYGISLIAFTLSLRAGEKHLNDLDIDQVA